MPAENNLPQQELPAANQFLILGHIGLLFADDWFKPEDICEKWPELKKEVVLQICLNAQNGGFFVSQHSFDGYQFKSRFKFVK